MSWAAKDIERLRELCGKEGLTAEAIGAELGVSRNAVIGKCKRLGIALPRAFTPALKQAIIERKTAPRPLSPPPRREPLGLPRFPRLVPGAAPAAVQAPPAPLRLVHVAPPFTPMSPAERREAAERFLAWRKRYRARAAERVAGFGRQPEPSDGFEGEPDADAFELMEGIG
jgi:GcrA cell cycle regulator